MVLIRGDTVVIQKFYGNPLKSYMVKFPFKHPLKGFLKNVARNKVFLGQNETFRK